jgi:hypothetical protein
MSEFRIVIGQNCLGIRMKDTAFLLASHFYSVDVMKEFYKLQDAVQEDCFVLYHLRQGAFIDNMLFALPHFIVRTQSIDRLGYPPLFAQESLVPGSNHFPLIVFSQNYRYKYYWYIEYDVRFTGNWKDLFDYFKDDSDFLTAHIRWHKDEPEWCWWNYLVHPSSSIAQEVKLRSFNPIYRLSNAAIMHIDAMHKAGWTGHHEILMPTLLYKDGFKLRDFGGKGEFVRSGDKEKFYIDSTSHRLFDGTLCCWDRHQAYEKVKNKIFHPIKRNHGSDNGSEITLT